MADPSQAVNYGHEKIFTVTLNQLISSHFSIFLHFTPLYISLIYGVFFNNAFQDCSLKKNTYGAVDMLELLNILTFHILHLINTLNKSVTIMFIERLQMLVQFANKNVLNVFLWLLIGFIQFCFFIL